MRSLIQPMLAFIVVVSPIVAMPMAAAAMDRDGEVDRSLKVTVETVGKHRFESSVMATGTAAAFRLLPIGSEANGLAILDVTVDEGDTVKKGQTLARLNDRTLAAQREQHRAAVFEAEANLATAQSDQRRAHAVTSGVISTQAIEQRETLVKTATAKLAFARAMLDETEAKLLQTSILSPADAVVAVRSVTIGQVIEPGTELFQLIQDGRIEVNALVPETDLLKIKPQQAARVVDATGRQLQARVRLVAPIVDEKSRLGTVRLELPLNNDLKPGMFVRAEIVVDAGTSVTVPAKALVWRDGKPAVFTVSDDGTAVLRPLMIGRRTSATIEVLQGLTVGERVVIDGAGLVTDGERLRFDVANSGLPRAERP